MTLTECICSTCKKSFHRRNSDVKRSKNHYCSESCKAQAKRTGLVKQCGICSKEIYVRNKDIKETNFCTRSCAATYNNKKVAKRKLEGKCTVCSTNCSARHKYCSNTCKSKAVKNSKGLSKHTKLCPGCNLELPKTTEYFYSGVNQSWTSFCKECIPKERTTRNQNRKQECVDYKGGKCIVCSYNRFLGALEFHHLDPKEKDFGISKFSTKSFSNLKTELDKCVLLCSVCHREVHGGLVDLNKYV